MVREYVVNEEDTLSTIAAAYQMRWLALYKYDGGTGTPNRDRLRSGNPNVLYAGDVILVPNYETSLTGTSGGPTNVYVHSGASQQTGAQADLLIQVTDADTEAPIPDVNVHVQGPSCTRSAVTDAHGDACFEQLPPGRVEVRAARTGFDCGDQQPIPTTVSPTTVNRIEVHLKSTASIEVVVASPNPHKQKRNRYKADEQSPTAEYVRFGLWDEAYGETTCLGGPLQTIRNEKEESRNFVGADTRRFYFRVRDPSVPPGEKYISITWKTLTNDKQEDDAPASSDLRLARTRPDSDVFVSRAVMLTSDAVDQTHPTHSGFEDLGKRNRGQSNHRMREAELGGFVQADYKRDAAAPPQSVRVPTFNPEELRRLPIRIINYGGCTRKARIDKHMQIAQDRWRQVGLRVEESHYEPNRSVPPGMLDADGCYHGNNEEHPDRERAERAALGDLIPTAPDNTLTVAFVPALPEEEYGHAAIREVGPIPQPDGGHVAMENRFFVFITAEALPVASEVLAHELHHVLFNRFDVPVDRRYFTFNTTSPNEALRDDDICGLPDARVHRRIQNANVPAPSPNRARTHPDDDPQKKNILNWVRRRRSGRHPVANPNDGATPTTGNTLVKEWHPYDSP